MRSGSGTTLRVVVVDDEAPARTRIRNFLRDEPDVEIVAECANGEQAIEAVRRERPDLMFLDIRMPRLDGFGVFQHLREHELPLVVFTTAYDEYALRAFEVHAVDYLLKPFDRARFQKMLLHVRQRLAQPDASVPSHLASLLEMLREQVVPHGRIAVKTDGRTLFLRTEEIDWIEAEGNYVRIHAGAGAHLVRETMAWCEARLSAAHFVRISRSAIVNVERLKEVQPLFYGDQVLILRDGQKLTLSRHYRERFEDLVQRQALGKGNEPA
jgi:two-component system LytT family response regulator